MKAETKAKRIAEIAPPARGKLPSAAERTAAGEAMRERVPHESHSVWRPGPRREDPIAILRAAEKTRVQELVPIRYGRMLPSPFTFYRGSAAVMAADLAVTPSTGIHVQACGDAHLMNFGGFATPERSIIVDINDFDETSPAPWEWDLKRLATSFVLAARSNGLGNRDARALAEVCAHSYRKHMRGYAKTNVLDIWYAHIDSTNILEMVPAARQAMIRKRITKATVASSSELVFPKLVDAAGAQPRIRDDPPLIFHRAELHGLPDERRVETALARYRETLAEDRRSLFDRYRLVDTAVKVVGIGSVGTLCMVCLFVSLAGDPLFLQVKQAGASVLERHVGTGAFEHGGQRVVMGQRHMQPVSDIFLGWTTDEETGRQFYVRQLRDVKLSPLVETFDTQMMSIYAELCGWVLARAHAKAGDPWTIGGYLGGKRSFDEAIATFAVQYADQAERDHESLKRAVQSGAVDVVVER